MKKSRLFILTMLILGVLCVFASTWDGSAIVGAYGDFPLQGYYGACNSFPRNTIIDVTNQANNKTVTIIITRELSASGILIALSPEAAQALGIIAGTTALVRLTNPRLTGQTLGTGQTGAVGSDNDDLRKKAEAELARLGYAVSAPVSTPAQQVPPQQTGTGQTSTTGQTSPGTSQERLVPQTSQVVGMPVPETPGGTASSTPITTQPTTPATTTPTTVTQTEKPQLFDGKPKPIRTVIISGLPIPELASGQTTQAVTQIAPTIPQTPNITQTSTQPPQQMQTAMAQPEVYTLISVPFEQLSKQKDIYAEPGIRSQESATVFAKRNASGLPVDVPYADLPAPERERALVLERLGLLGTSLAFNLPDYDEPFLNPSERATIIDKTWFQVPGKPLAVDLAEPTFGNAERGIAFEKGLVAPLPDSVAAELADPSAMDQELAQLYAKGLVIPAQGTVSADLADPSTMEQERAILYALGLRSPFSDYTGTDLLDPGMYAAERAAIYAFRMQRALTAGDLDVALADPLMVAEEIPVSYLSYQPLPKQSEPSLTLAEGTIKLDDRSPSAVLSYQKPFMQAAETVIQLETLPLADPKQQVVKVVTPENLPPGETVITMLPTTERPPQSTQNATASQTVIPGTGQQASSVTQPQTGTALAKGFYYVQIASFSTEDALNKAMKGLGNRYVLFVEKAVVKGKTVFRLYIGPLKKDETGVALMFARSLGYKDAFIKEGS